MRTEVEVTAIAREIRMTSYILDFKKIVFFSWCHNDNFAHRQCDLDSKILVIFPLVKEGEEATELISMTHEL